MAENNVCWTLEKTSMDNFLGTFSYTFSITIQYTTVFTIKNKFWKVILTFYFDLVPPFSYLKWNRFFSTFTLVLLETRPYFNYLLPREVCTNSKIRFRLIKFSYIIWILISKETILRSTHLINIYSFWNCLSKNLLLIRLIIIILF